MAEPAASSTANGGSIIDSTRSNAAAAYNSLAKGPVAQNVKEHTAKASSELSNLAAARKTPSTPAATGQPLTHYHSFFSELLSWKNPRASAISYASIVTLIFAGRYLNIASWALRCAWMTLGATVAAEAVGRFLFNSGLASQLRPRRYYTVPRERLDGMIGDVHELLNFFVIEAQRILFAESLAASAASFVCAFLTYYLIKLMPFWGLAVLGTTLAFFTPLIYKNNQELIDHHLQNASDTISAQTEQFRNVAQKQAGHISAMGKQYAGDYTGKVQELLGRGRASSPAAKAPEFPSPPTEEPQQASTPAGSVPTEKEQAAA